jgi:hypothetical protein
MVKLRLNSVIFDAEVQQHCWTIEYSGNRGVFLNVLPQKFLNVISVREFSFCSSIWEWAFTFSQDVQLTVGRRRYLEALVFCIYVCLLSHTYPGSFLKIAYVHAFRSPDNCFTKRLSPQRGFEVHSYFRTSLYQQAGKLWPLVSNQVFFKSVLSFFKSVFVNKVLLEHSHANLLMYYLRFLSSYSGRVE